MVVFIDFSGELRVPDYVPVPIEDEEVRTPDDNDRAPADCRFVPKLRLINYGNTIPYGFQGSRVPLASLNNTDVLVVKSRCGAVV